MGTTAQGTGRKKMTDFPVIMTSAGAQPTPPAVLNAQLIADVTAINPGVTFTLPGSLIEDISSTDTAAMVQMDQARVETINSLNVNGANDWLLLQQGQLFIGPGAAPGIPTNTSVDIIFTALDPNTSAPLAGVSIGMGYTVSDGTYQYVLQDNVVTASDGITPAAEAIATIPGSWAVASGTVNQPVTSPPQNVNLSVTNPATGTPGNPNAETAQAFLARVMQAVQAVATGLTTLLKTSLANVSGVQQRLISVRQQGSGWEVIVGGGDPYEVAAAIVDSGLNIAGLVGSTIAVTNISSATVGVVTTDINHGYITGQDVTMTGIVGPTALNGVAYPVTVIDEKHFSIPVNTTLLPAYVSGGVCSPNSRNLTPAIYDDPDTYTVPFVAPPQQTVTMVVTWNTTQANFASAASVAQLAATAIANYINAILVTGPISLVELNAVFAAAVSSILDPSTLSVLNFAVSINGVSTPPVAGTQLIEGDLESYFFAQVSGIAVVQS
jgi:Ubiquitin-activating enzyme E1 FCCH domain